MPPIPPGKGEREDEGVHFKPPYIVNIEQGV